MYRYFINLSYDGAHYHGWQIQPNGISVQEVLNKTLSTLLRENIEVTGAGRTDAGVNASMMIAHFDTTKPVNDNLAYKMNKFLPHDIAIHDIKMVNEEAHARFSATSRTYHYYIITEKCPFEPYAYRYPLQLNFGLMNQAAKTLYDYTDFTSFSKLHTDVKTNNCKVTIAEWKQVSDIKWEFTITADRFLRNMVRAIVGTLIDVGRGAITIDQFKEIIEKKDRCSAGSSVPGNALFLSNITYPDSVYDLDIKSVKQTI